MQATKHRYNNKAAYIILEAPNYSIPQFHVFEAVHPRPKVRWSWYFCFFNTKHVDIVEFICVHTQTPVISFLTILMLTLSNCPGECLL